MGKGDDYVDSLFSDDEGVWDSYQSNVLPKRFENTFDLDEESFPEEINKKQYELGVFLLTLAQLHTIRKEDILKSLDTISKNNNNEEEWEFPQNTPEEMKLFIQKISSVIYDFNIPIHINPIENEKPKKIIEKEPKKKYEKLFSDEEDEEDDEEEENDQNQVTNEDIDEFWTSIGSTPSNISTKKRKNKKIKVDLPGLEDLLEENYDYETLEENLESEFLKLDIKQKNNQDDNENESDDDTDVVLSQVFGKIVTKLPKGKVNSDAALHASHTVMMSAFSDDEGENFTDEILKAQLLEDEDIFHDDLGLESDDEENKNISNEEVEEEEEVVIEYVDEDGNVVEAPDDDNSDVEYEYVYEEVDDDGTISDEDIKEEKIKKDGSEEFEFDEDLEIDEETLKNVDLTSWESLLMEDF